MQVSMTVNGKLHHADVEPRLLLVDFIRDMLNLTGTKVGCDTAQCGTCTVLVNGRSVKSCSMLTVQADGCEVRTIEDVSQDGQLNTLQEAFMQEHGLQCGFCTPGMIMGLLDLLQRNANPREEEIRAWLDGNLCRCTGYQNVIRAVQSAIVKMQQAATEAELVTTS